MKTTLVCMPGLASSPEIIFGKLATHFCRREDYKVLFAPINNIITHDDRIRSVIETFMDEVASDPEARIFLVGHSAGASAVRIAAECIGKHDNLKGVIMLSPAMPRWVWFATMTLAKVMAGRLWKLLFGKSASLSEDELTELLYPVNVVEIHKFWQASVPVSLAEARKLAFWPDKLGKCHCPILIVGGSQDRWIAPRAYEELTRMLIRTGHGVHPVMIDEAGHFLTAPRHIDQVCGVIHGWVSQH